MPIQVASTPQAPPGRRGGEFVTVLEPGTVPDLYSGEPTDSWADADVTTRDVLTLVPPEPRPSSEPVQDARNAVTSGWTLYLPAGDPITARSRVVVRGVVYPVQGEPASWPKGVVVQAYGTAG